MGPAEIVRFLKERVALFEGFAEEPLGRLVAASTVTTFEPNEAIIEFGEEGRFLGVLLEGEAEASIADDAGDRRQLGRLGPGSIFGEMSLMTGDRTVADVIGLTRATALLVPQRLFATVVATHPPALRLLARTLSERAKGYGEDVAKVALRRADDPYGLELRTPQPAKLLVINCGSSSLKYNLFDTADATRNARGIVERIGSDTARLVHRVGEDKQIRDLGRAGFAEAFAAIVGALTAKSGGVLGSLDEIAAVGHRVVHGGEHFSAATLLDDAVVREIEAVSPLAPLHNPANLTGIREARRLWPEAPHVAVFDTAFHHTLPEYAYLYGLPYELYEKQRIRRYGFHGTSHFYAALKAAQFLRRPFNSLEIVTCHLGNGASCCAVDHGRSVDTSMGLTPAEGLIMGTRAGDVDAGVLVHLMRSEKLGADQIDALVNKKSGLLGLSGVSNDMREIEEAAQSGNGRALSAFKAFAYRVRKYIGAYAAAMGGIDVVVFTGGIGQGSAHARSLACQGLDWMGIRVDEQRNRTARGFDEVCRISEDGAATEVLVVPADEERMIARETLRALSRQEVTLRIRAQEPLPVPIEVSAHHVHLAQAEVEALFGPGHQLKPRSELSQPGQFACEEQVNLVGPKGRIDRVRVLGPARKATQVEIAVTEQFKLGIVAPIRESGDVKGTPAVTLEGPAGKVALPEGVIAAMRHIHMAPEDALRYGVRDKYVVRVRVGGDRELIFGDVLVRVSPSYKLAMHLDTDEANAASIATGTPGYIDGVQAEA
ncbi:MAG: acetate/propionate family kinase [Deltaproteobacteria bacterium]|nr:acetate/propionate family kinase [Deltaproteobacteria bacterium]